MQISRKSDYALRAVTILASMAPDRSLQAQELADVGKIPIKFLEQILLVMKRSGILQSKRGVGGGYRLNKESRHITLAEVIEAVDGELVRFMEPDEIPGFEGSAGLKHYLSEAESVVNDRLRSITVEDLISHSVGDSMVGYGI